MDIERAFLSKVALSGQIEKSIADGFNETHFESGIKQDIFSYMAEHTRKFSGPPSMVVLREKFPEFNFDAPTDSLEYLSDRFRKHVKRRFAMTSLKDLAEIVANVEHVDKIEGMFLEEARRLAQLVPTTEVHKFSDMDKRIEIYESGEQINRGIKMGISDFDRLTFGIQPHEFVSIVGWQGTGKSTLAQWILYQAWMQERKGMIISLEMEAPALLRKWDTMINNFEYRALKAHELGEKELEDWKKKAEQVKKAKGDIIVRADVRSCTPDYVFAETMRYQPDIVVVDYVTLMDTSRTAGSQMWEKVTYLTQSLKQIARTTGVPIIGVAQTNIGSADGGAKLENIAYSRSIGQDSDIVLGLHQDDEMKEEKKMTVRMLKNRDGATTAADLLWDMDYMKFSLWSEVDFFKNRERRERQYEEDLITTEDGTKIDPRTGEIIEI